MSVITVEQLAKVVGITTSTLLDKLRDAGISVTDAQMVLTPEQKKILLAKLKEGDKRTGSVILTLNKKQADVESGASVNVTILKRRTQYEATDSLIEEEKLIQKKEEKLKEESVIAINNETKEEKESPQAKTLEEVSIKKEEKPSAEPGDLEKDFTEKEKKKDKKEKAVNKKERKERFIEPQLLEEEDSATEEIKNSALPKNYKMYGENFQRRTGKNRKNKPDNNEKARENLGPEVNKNREIVIPETLTVAELGQRMALKVAEIIKVLFKLGTMATINQLIDQATAALVVEELGFKAKLVKETVTEDNLVLLEEMADNEEVLRAPVVTIMGHVDHGKTSLLDFIRRTKVAAKEAGGITQRIGAYRVSTQKGEITFLDTPGHEAFTAIRARGAKCTDIVVLVVAADDGVKPQTVEAIKHAQAAKAPIIVAVNKIDKPGADPERVKTELSKYNVIPEAWGGDVIFQNISAKQGTGIDELLDSISVLAEVLELKAAVNTVARGIVLEAHLDKGHGPVATILVQQGTLRQGDILLAGLYFGKVRAMLDDSGVKIKSALPSHPVEVLGLSGVPVPGDDFLVLGSEKKAREVALFRQGKFRDAKLAKQSIKLENILTKMKEHESKILNVVLKADLQGSLEALVDMLGKITVDEVRVEVVAEGVGGITESDVNLALASHGIVIGFNVRADSAAKVLAEREGVDLRYYSVIYKLMDDIKTALSGMLAPTYEEQIIGLAEVREVFRSSKFGTIAGCMVLTGFIKKGISIRVLRSQVVIYNGEVESLRRFKEDVNEVKQGIDCGIGIKGYNNFEVGDQIEAYKNVLVKRANS